MVTAVKPKQGTKQFSTDNNGHLETYTFPEMYMFYLQEVSKQEYPDFERWLVDMLRSGIFKRL